MGLRPIVSIGCAFLTGSFALFLQVHNEVRVIMPQLCVFTQGMQERCGKTKLS